MLSTNARMTQTLDSGAAARAQVCVIPTTGMSAAAGTTAGNATYVTRNGAWSIERKPMFVGSLHPRRWPQSPPS